MTTNRSLLRSFSKYVTLNVLGMTGLSCYILADTFFIAQGLGSVGLAALNLAISFYSFIHGIGLMVGMGGATKYAIFKAQGKNDEADAIFTHALGLGLSFGALFFFIGLFFSTQVAALLGADGETLSLTAVYLKTILCFAPFFILNNLTLAFVRNDGAPNLAMSAMLLGSFSNILLDYLFIFPMGMGLFGAALATGLAPILSLLLLSSHFLRGKNHFRPRACAFRPGYCLNVMSLGISALITEVASGIVLIVFNLMILSLTGNTGVAAYGIIANLALVVIAMFTGVAQGMQPLVSERYGLGDRAALKPLLFYGLFTALLLALAAYLAVLLFPDALVAVFNSENDPQLARLAKQGLYLYFPGFFFAGINVVGSAYLSAIEAPLQAFFISIGRGFLFILPLVFLLSSLLGMTGIWLSFPVGEGVSAALTAFFLLKGPKATSSRRLHRQSRLR